MLIETDTKIFCKKRLCHMVMVWSIQSVRYCRVVHVGMRHWLRSKVEQVLEVLLLKTNQNISPPKQLRKGLQFCLQFTNEVSCNRFVFPTLI